MMKNQGILIGCVADDFTGASDAASFLRGSGLNVLLYTKRPDSGDQIRDCDAVVITLKTRSIPPQEAVRQYMDAFSFLDSIGTRQLYYKYCSTFNSTKSGNIGPVLDAALKMWNEPFTLLCPSLPVNGRTIKEERLYVDGVPLHETHMRNHPVNPMWASEIAVLMREQSRYPCYPLSIGDMKQGAEHIALLTAAYAQASRHFYLVPDYYEEGHAEQIYSLFGDLKILSGGSGLLAAANRGGDKAAADGFSPRIEKGKTLLLAGSCSKMTLAQIREYQKRHRSIKADPLMVVNGTQTAQTLWEEAKGIDGALIYSSEPPKEIARIPAEMLPLVSQKLECLMAQLAETAAANGYTQIIAAGGETSGAVAKALAYRICRIGESVAPGVPVMMPVDAPQIRLVLKSGNFGDVDFFERAVEMTNH